MLRLRTLRHLFLLLIALWLPIQPVVAYAMPLCTQGEGGHAAMAHEAARAIAHDMALAMADHGQPQHEHAAHAPQQDDRAAGAAWPSCDQCGVCHLACASFLGSVADQMTAPFIDHIQNASAPPAVTFPYPARFERPPSLPA